MYRVNQIIKTISKMNSYAPYNQINKKSNLLRKVQVYSFLTSLFSLILMAIMAVIYKIFDFPKEPFILPAFVLYILNSVAGIVYLFTPIIPGVKFMLNFKKEIFNDLICEIDNDEQNVEKLMPYSITELNYAIDWLNIKIQRLKLRINDFFGEKTAVLSIIGLAYSAIQGFGGLNKLGETISKGLFNSGTTNTLIVFGLFFLLGLSLGALALKNLANNLQYLKEMLELAKKIKQQNNE
ncbi:hypothetical protein R1V40_000922 [Salmonella enterica]|nr:hypothetical protein [Salmonella enterica]EDN6370085.1 hypothetical protein [Salmonella enterica]EDW3215006.1 hypothetical protein [Salmonella enterica]EEK4545757.1 hypothetical protein [Salmonella enterica]EEK6054309.1 hypothetical protein [Salmonella enterica]